LRIGILGGTFNPVHMGHLHMAQKIKEALALDRMLLMVAAQPPHKQVDFQVSAQLRYEMTRLAAEEFEGIQASDIELAREGKSYTALTLLELKARYPDSTLFYIVGSDMLLDLPRWYRAETIFQNCEIVCVKREGEYFGKEQQQIDYLTQTFGAKIHCMPFTVEPISSTQVRQAVYEALPISDAVPESVEHFIYEQGLYFPQDILIMQEKCRSALNNNRYHHTMRTVMTAIELAHRFGADAKRARLAALLHDCARGMSLSQMQELLQQSGMQVDAKSMDSVSLLHAHAGAALAKTQFGIDDPAILQAIAGHTTGTDHMNMLDKIIYLADMIEPGRDFPGVERLRSLAKQNLDRAVLAAMEHTLSYLKSRGQSIHPDSVAALEALKKENLPQ